MKGIKHSLAITAVTITALTTLVSCDDSPVSNGLDINAKTIPAALILYEYNKNSLRAKDTFSNGSYNVVGLFYSAKMEKDGYRLTIIEAPESSSYIYANLPSSASDAVKSMNRGNLVTVTCQKLGDYGSSAIFERCDYLRATETSGVKPDIYLDKLIFDNNELLNGNNDTKGNKKKAASISSGNSPTAAANSDSEIFYPLSVTNAENGNYTVSLGWENDPAVARQTLTVVRSDENSESIIAFLKNNIGKRVRISHAIKGNGDIVTAVKSPD